MPFNTRLSAALLLLMALPVAAQHTACVSNLTNSSPPEQFDLSANDGTVRHIPTNLTYKRCLEGLNWTGTTCEATQEEMGNLGPNFYNMEQALAAARSSTFAGRQWRLPNIKELKSLLQYNCAYAFNLDIFPIRDPEVFYKQTNGLPLKAIHVWSNTFIPLTENPISNGYGFLFMIIYEADINSLVGYIEDRAVTDTKNVLLVSDN